MNTINALFLSFVQLFLLFGLEFEFLEPNQFAMDNNIIFGVIIGFFILLFIVLSIWMVSLLALDFYLFMHNETVFQYKTRNRSEKDSRGIGKIKPCTIKSSCSSSSCSLSSKDKNHGGRDYERTADKKGNNIVCDVKKTEQSPKKELGESVHDSHHQTNFNSEYGTGDDGVDEGSRFHATVEEKEADRSMFNELNTSALPLIHSKAH